MSGLVVVGTSLGGMSALGVLLGGLQKDLPWAIAIVQHRSTEDVEDTLVAVLQSQCVLPVAEVEDKDPIQAGRVYLAPPDYHLLVEQTGFALSTEPRLLHARPSIDALFESAAAVYRERTVGVVLTGASRDGAAGIEHIKRLGGHAIVQEPSTAEARVMPEAAIAGGQVDLVLPLAEIAGALNRYTWLRR